MPSYLDHVRSNNHARLFSYPRSYIYTYVNIHICRYRIYVATPVPQRVKSTFYFDEPSGYDTRSRRYPLVVQLFLFFFSFSIRTCFDIPPPPPELLLFSSTCPRREFDRSFAWKSSRSFCVGKVEERYIQIAGIRIEIYTRSTIRRYLLGYRNENIYDRHYWNNKWECVMFCGNNFPRYKYYFVEGK